MKQEHIFGMDDVYLNIAKPFEDKSRIPLATRQRNKTDSLQKHSEQQQVGWQWVFQFNQLLDTWEGPVFQALNQLAQLRWPSEYVFGLIPINLYRLRDAQIDETHLWWVEYDLTASQDHHQCAAYYACMVLNDAEQPVLTIQTGTKAYPVSPLTVENLRARAIEAGHDPPLVIPKIC